MPPPCGGCIHPERPDLDAQSVLAASSNETIGRKFGLSKDAVRRHRLHISAALAKVLTEEAGPRKAVEKLDELWSRVEKVLTKAEQSSNGTLAINAAKELRAVTELHAKLTGELDESTKIQIVNLSTSPDWIAARSAMFEVLSGFPEAAQAVSARLMIIEA